MQGTNDKYTSFITEEYPHCARVIFYLVANLLQLVETSELQFLQLKYRTVKVGRAKRGL